MVAAPERPPVGTARLPTLIEAVLLLTLLRAELGRVVVPGPGLPAGDGQMRSVKAERPAGSQRPLTHRECDVLIALSSGATNKQIAEDLGLSPKTVMHHSMAIYKKLDVRGRAGATAWAYRNGLFGLG